MIMQRTRFLLTRRNAAVAFSKRFQSTAAPQKVLEKPTESPLSEEQPSQEVVELSKRISQLNLLETSQLVSILKKKLNISSIAPMQMPMQNAPAAQAQAEAPAKEEKQEKTEFTLKLEKIDAGSKAKIIREIKNLMPNFNLVEAKKFVESAPKIVKENVPKEEAEKIKKALEAVGAVVSMS